MNPFLIVEREGAIVTATINRPEQRNAITMQSDVEEIERLCRTLEEDNSVRMLILTGVGSAFCAGGNIRDMASRTGMFAGSPVTVRNNYRTNIQRIPKALYELEIPVIAAVNGPAVGAGLDLACMCDIRLAADTAKFAESFVRLGIVPGDGGAWLLPRIIGMARASIMTLTGDVIDANKALEYGLVSEVVPPEQLLDAARNLAHRIVANPGHATRFAKRLLREGQDMKLGPLLELSAAYQALAHYTEDHVEAVEASLAKRDAIFRDR